MYGWALDMSQAITLNYLNHNCHFSTESHIKETFKIKIKNLTKCNETKYESWLLFLLAVQLSNA